MSSLEAVVLFAAAAVAGVINSIAGGGSLISFPALVWSGIDPVIANATNTVAISPGALAAALPFRRELRGMGRWLRLLGPPSVVGGGLGAWLLLVTPERIFAELVPGLILLSTVTFALQEFFARRVARRDGDASELGDPGAAVAGEFGAVGDQRTAAPHVSDEPSHVAPAMVPGVAIALQLAIALYGGYFGAGIGIMMLATLGFLGLRDLHRMIALRSVLGFCINLVASIWFVARGTVDWPAAALMAAGQVVGGYAGAALARRVSRTLVRQVVIAIGLGTAISFFLTRG